MSDRLSPGEYHWTAKIRMTAELKDRLCALASQERRSLAVFLGNALQDFVTARSTT